MSSSSSDPHDEPPPPSSKIENDVKWSVFPHIWDSFVSKHLSWHSNSPVSSFKNDKHASSTSISLYSGGTSKHISTGSSNCVIKFPFADNVISRTGNPNPISITWITKSPSVPSGKETLPIGFPFSSTIIFSSSSRNTWLLTDTPVINDGVADCDIVDEPETDGNGGSETNIWDIDEDDDIIGIPDIDDESDFEIDGVNDGDIDDVLLGVLLGVIDTDGVSVTLDDGVTLNVGEVDIVGVLGSVIDLVDVWVILDVTDDV